MGSLTFWCAALSFAKGKSRFARHARKMPWHGAVPIVPCYSILTGLRSRHSSLVFSSLLQPSGYVEGRVYDSIIVDRAKHLIQRWRMHISAYAYKQTNNCTYTTLPMREEEFGQERRGGREAVARARRQDSIAPSIVCIIFFGELFSGRKVCVGTLVPTAMVVSFQWKSLIDSF